MHRKETALMSTNQVMAHRSGEIARLTDQPRDACPHEKGVLRDAWLFGWDLANWKETPVYVIQEFNPDRPEQSCFIDIKNDGQILYSTRPEGGKIFASKDEATAAAAQTGYPAKFLRVLAYRQGDICAR
jgi:ribosome modulation factor